MGKVGYPTEPLSTRAVIKHGVYSVIPPEGRVINTIPGFEGFESTILASPKLGASFVMIISTVIPVQRRLYRGVETELRLLSILWMVRVSLP